MAEFIPVKEQSDEKGLALMQDVNGEDGKRCKDIVTNKC